MMNTRYFEDLEVGRTHDLGSYNVDRHEMTSFAERYDPQPIHTDEAVVADSMFDGIIASGWYTASVCMRLLVDGFLTDVKSITAIGIEELTWHEPVQPGDQIIATCEILNLRESKSHDDRGYLTLWIVGRTNDGVKLISWASNSIVRKRP